LNRQAIGATVAENAVNPAAMWDERFGKAEPVYGDEPNAYMREQAARIERGKKILVPGDGYGRNGIWLAKQGFEVHTVDVSQVGVERARASAEKAGVKMHIEQADALVWRWPVAEFDAVFSIFFHMPSVMRAEVHPKMLAALKPGGLLILTAFTPGQLKFTSGGPKQVDLLCTAEILKQDFAPAEVVELEEVEVELKEGRTHSGRGAVVQGVFRKNS
jgi:SAM-dependent methyltransferase